MSMRRAGVTALLLTLGLSDAQSSVLEEIVVTAQKRDESLQDVGIAVTAFDQDQLKQLGWATAERITAMTPGVTTIQPAGPSAYFTNIRGSAQNDFSGDHQESPVAVYVDEVYISAASGAGFQLFDQERVEILRGPQGTLFGRNATGGLVHYITRKPEQQRSGYLEITYGDYNQRKIEGALGGGIAEKVSGRLSFVRNKHDGVLENRVGPDLNDGNNWAIRGQLLIESDNWDWLVSLRAAEQDVDVGPFSHRSARLNPVTGLGEEYNGLDLLDSGDSRVAQGYQDPERDLFKTSNNVIGFNDIQTRGVTSRFTMGINDSMELVAVTDLTRHKKDYLEDSDVGPHDFFAFALKSDLEQISQEIRISGATERINWVAGVYYLGIDGDFFNGGAAANFFAAAFPGLGLDAPALETLGLNNPFSTDTQSLAVFAQLDYALSDTLQITGGLRWFREKKEIEFHQFLSLFDSPTTSNVVVEDGLGLGGPVWTFSPQEVSNLPGGAALGFPAVIGDPDLAKLDDDLIAAKLSLEWEPSDDLLWYMSYNRGIKAGGFNAPLDAIDFFEDLRTPEEMTFDEEVLNSYETGLKWTFADGRARLNTAAFYYDYRDYQAFALDSLTTVVFNTDAESYGIEIELQASPIDGLDILLGIGWIDNTVEDAFTRPDNTVIDREAVLTPELNVVGMIRYEWPFAKGSLSSQLDFNYMDSHFFQLKNSPIGKEDSYIISNARLSYRSQSGKWLSSIYVNNITDEDHRMMVFDLAGTPAQGGFGMSENFAGPPRWWGVSVQFFLGE